MSVGTTSAPSPAARRHGPLDRWALPGLVHAGGQLVTVAAVEATAVARGRAPWRWLDSWDGHNFLRVATEGYRGAMPKGRSPMAFFPGYPAAIGVVRAVTGAPAEAVGVVVSVAAGLAMAYGLVALVRELGGGPRSGLVLVALASTGPLSVVFSMVYSEALFCACAVWTLVLVQRRSWGLAGAVCAVAGLVRPTGIALVASVVVGVLLARHEQGTARRAWGGLAIAPLGVLGYLSWVALRTGTPLGWFGLQRRGWGTGFDFGAFTVRRSVEALVVPASLHGVLTVVLALTALGLARRMVAEHLPWPLVAYVAVVLVQDLGSAGIWGSKVRLLLPALPLLLPLLAEVRRRVRAPAGARTRVVVPALLLAWAVLGVTYSAYTVDVYGHAL